MSGMVNTDGTVFAVEDEYQIAWSTSVKSTGSVTVNGTTYYDESNGQNRVSTLHKVSVPMSELDVAGGYTINSTPVYSEAAYLAIRGKQHSVRHAFRPADAARKRDTGENPRFGRGLERMCGNVFRISSR